MMQTFMRVSVFKRQHRPAGFLCWMMHGNLVGFFDAFKRSRPASAEHPAPANQEDVGRMMAAAQQYGIQILEGR